MCCVAFGRVYGGGSSLFYLGENNNVISYDGDMVFCFSFLIYCRSKNILAAKLRIYEKRLII